MPVHRDVRVSARPHHVLGHGWLGAFHASLSADCAMPIGARKSDRMAVTYRQARHITADLPSSRPSGGLVLRAGKDFGIISS